MTPLFAYAVTENTVFGNNRVVFGTYTNTGTATGGAITTGLSSVSFFAMDTNTASAVFMSSASGGVVTITNVSNQTGKWMAVGL